MDKYILFLNPHGTANLVVDEAISEGYKAIAVVSNKIFVKNYSKSLFKEIIYVDTFNYSAKIPVWFLDLNNKYKLVGVYFNTDGCFITANQIREFLNLPYISPAIAKSILNKATVRSLLLKNKLSNIKYIDADHIDAMDKWPFKGDAFFKPIYGCASAFVKKVKNFDQFDGARKQFTSLRQNYPALVTSLLNTDGNSFMLEESVNGELISVECMSSKGRCNVIGILSRILYSKNCIIEMGSCFPYPNKISNKIVNFAQAVHRALGFSDGPTHVEIMIDKDNNLEVIDFNPRVVGADVIHSINNSYSIKYEKNLLKYACGFDSEFGQLKLHGYSVLQYVLTPEPLVFESIDLPSGDFVRFTKVFIEPGTKIESTEKQTDYVGCYLIFAKSYDSAMQLARNLRKDVYINKNIRGSF